MKIAIIAPKEKDDYLLNDCLDGFFQLKKERSDLVVRISQGLIHPFPKDAIAAIELPEEEFIDFARSTDIIILTQRKGGTDFALAEKIGVWEKTVFLDGSELGKNRRFDFSIQNEVLHGRYNENGGVNMGMLSRCAAYFRREKPYLPGIVPFPYSIQSGYSKYYDPKKTKDIDFVCIFGQDEFPLMRRYAVQVLEEYCKKNGFTFHTAKTKDFDFSLDRKSGRDEFYEILSRAKVGISIGGGGFDSVRFWETLANNCLVITERIDIFEPDSKELAYKRMYECNNLYDFAYQLEKVGEYLKNGYNSQDLEAEYADIMKKHSSKVRAEKLISVSLASIEKKIALKKEAQQCAIIISSCDKYADLWEPFFTLLFKYWPDCPFPIYLVSNTKNFSHEKVNMILVGEDKGWATNMQEALARVQEKNILYLQEDYLLQSPVNSKKIQDILDYMYQASVASVRLIGSPDPKHPHHNPFGLYEIKKGELYRVSLQGALWKKDIFLNLIKTGESGWDMEKEGTIRSCSLPEIFLSAKKKEPILDYYFYTAIKKGKWMPGALRLLKKEGIQVDAAKRGVHSDKGIILGRIRNLISGLRG